MSFQGVKHYEIAKRIHENPQQFYDLFYNHHVGSPQENKELCTKILLDLGFTLSEVYYLHQCDFNMTKYGKLPEGSTEEKVEQSSSAVFESCEKTTPSRSSMTTLSDEARSQPLSISSDSLKRSPPLDQVEHSSSIPLQITRGFDSNPISTSSLPNMFDGKSDSSKSRLASSSTDIHEDVTTKIDQKHPHPLSYTSTDLQTNSYSRNEDLIDTKDDVPKSSRIKDTHQMPSDQVDGSVSSLNDDTLQFKFD